MEDFISVLFGACIGGFLMHGVISSESHTPQEAPMIERCELFNTTLKSYDHYTAKCENGIEFKRSAL